MYNLESIVLLLSRLVLGAVFIYHGWPKIKNMKANAKWFNQIGFKPGNFWGTLVALVEFIGGIALVVGVYVQLAALLLAIEMIIGALWKVVSQKKPFKEYSYDLMALAIAANLYVSGPGMYTL